MGKSWHENRFDGRMKFEDNDGKIWESEELDSLEFWEIDDLELHVSQD